MLVDRAINSCERVSSRGAAFAAADFLAPGFVSAPGGDWPDKRARPSLYLEALAAEYRTFWIRRPGPAHKLNAQRTAESAATGPLTNRRHGSDQPCVFA